MRKNKNRLMKGLLYGLVVCGVIVISLRLYSMYTICISPDSFFEPNLPREDLILVTGLRYSLLYPSYCTESVYHLRSGVESGKFISKAHTVSNS